MKKLLSTILLTLTLYLSHAQLVNENFNTIQVNKVPVDWTVSPNTKVTNYTRPFECTATDRGLETPGVGQNAPSRMILPVTTYDASNNIIKISFTIWVLDPNINCSSAKNFVCPTYVSAYLVKTVSKSNKLYYTDGGNEHTINSLPLANEYYSSSSYQLVEANTANTIFFTAPAIPDGASYRIYLDFKTADGSNCSSSGTKFIFDDITITKNKCASCAPVARSDYFRAADNGFTNRLDANVFGGNLKWMSQIPATFHERSLTDEPAVENGLDEDLNDPDLSSMEFTLVTGSLSAISSCSTTPTTLNAFSFNKNGTFTVDRGTNTCISRVTFSYFIKNITTGKVSGNATVTIDFSSEVVLPVHFKSFTAARNQQRKEQVLLKWETASEQNNDSLGLITEKGMSSGNPLLH